MVASPGLEECFWAVTAWPRRMEFGGPARWISVSPMPLVEWSVVSHSPSKEGSTTALGKPLMAHLSWLEFESKSCKPSQVPRMRGNSVLFVVIVCFVAKQDSLQHIRSVSVRNTFRKPQRLWKCHAQLLFESLSMSNSNNKTSYYWRVSWSLWRESYPHFAWKWNTKDFSESFSFISRLSAKVRLRVDTKFTIYHPPPEKNRPFLQLIVMYPWKNNCAQLCVHSQDGRESPGRSLEKPSSIFEGLSKLFKVNKLNWKRYYWNVVHWHYFKNSGFCDQYSW